MALRDFLISNGYILCVYISTGTKVISDSKFNGNEYELGKDSQGGSFSNFFDAPEDTDEFLKSRLPITIYEQTKEKLGSDIVYKVENPPRFNNNPEAQNTSIVVPNSEAKTVEISLAQNFIDNGDVARGYVNNYQRGDIVFYIVGPLYESGPLTVFTVFSFCTVIYATDWMTPARPYIYINLFARKNKESQDDLVKSGTAYWQFLKSLLTQIVITKIDIRPTGLSIPFDYSGFIGNGKLGGVIASGVLSAMEFWKKQEFKETSDFDPVFSAEDVKSKLSKQIANIWDQGEDIVFQGVELPRNVIVLDKQTLKDLSQSQSQSQSQHSFAILEFTGQINRSEDNMEIHAANYGYKGDYDDEGDEGDDEDDDDNDEGDSSTNKTSNKKAKNTENTDVSNAVTNSNEIQLKSESKSAYKPKIADTYDTASIGTFTSKNSNRSSKIDPHIGRQRQRNEFSDLSDSERSDSGRSDSERSDSGRSDSGRSYSRVPPITTTIRPITRPITGIKGTRNRGGSKSKKRNKTLIKRRNKRQTKKQNKRQSKRRKSRKQRKSRKNKKLKTKKLLNK